MLFLSLPEFGVDFAGLTLLALVQGLTEFLPISSSGHLVLAQSAMGVEEPALTLDVALHVGTLLAVVIVYRRDLLALIAGLFRGQWREPGLIVLGTIPAGIFGVVFKDHIEVAFREPRLVAGGLLFTAVMLLLGEHARRRARLAGGEARSREVLRGLTWRGALLIGCAQALAIVPGISRSGSTIATGLMCGLAPGVAARFSFLLSIPAICGAAVLNLPGVVDEGVGGEWKAVLWAAAFAGLVGWGALRVLLTFLGRGAFGWFAAYCVGLGVGALILS